MGQALTGFTPNDDKNVFNVGVGGNGKSTLLDPIRLCLGDYSAMVPQKLLIADPSAHPTELMTLRGIRLAVLEELPETSKLNTQRLKAISGTETITARGMRQDFVEFPATHALIINTNHTPSVVETDHGTWRRLEMIEFNRAYRGSQIDHTLRERVHRRPVREAVLAELVANAKAWYEGGQTMPISPSEVDRMTQKWRSEADDILAFVSDRLEPMLDGVVSLEEVRTEFNDWLTNQGGRHEWSPQLFRKRLRANEGLEVPFEEGPKARRYQAVNGPLTRANSPVAVWRGVAWRA
jgi:putative DNA primase/helicase